MAIQRGELSMPVDSGAPCSQAAIALGSNLGDSHSLLKFALHALEQSPGIAIAAQSAFYQTPPVGPPQPNYINACALLSTTLSPQELMSRLLTIEQQAGRVRQERWGPRLLDLDLLLYDHLILNTPTLNLPHPRLRERAFVLVPLTEIAPHWVDPVSGKAIAVLAEALDCSGVIKL